MLSICHAQSKYASLKLWDLIQTFHRCHMKIIVAAQFHEKMQDGSSRKNLKQNMFCILYIETFFPYHVLAFCEYSNSNLQIKFCHTNHNHSLFSFHVWVSCRYSRSMGLPSQFHCLARWRRAGLKFWILGSLIGYCLEMPLFLQKCQFSTLFGQNWQFWKLGIQIWPELFIFSTKLSLFTEALLCIKNLKFRVKTKSIPPSCFMSLMS